MLIQKKLKDKFGKVSNLSTSKGEVRFDVHNFEGKKDNRRTIRMDLKEILNDFQD